MNSGHTASVSNQLSLLSPWNNSFESMESSVQNKEQMFTVRYVEQGFFGEGDDDVWDSESQDRLVDHAQICLREAKRKRLERAKTAPKNLKFSKPTILLKVCDSELLLTRAPVEDKSRDHVAFPRAQVLAVFPDREDARVFGIVIKTDDGCDIITLKTFQGKSIKELFGLQEEENFLNSGIQAPEHRRQKCMLLKGEFEKEQVVIFTRRAAGICKVINDFIKGNEVDPQTAPHSPENLHHQQETSVMEDPPAWVFADDALLLGESFA